MKKSIKLKKLDLYLIKSFIGPLLVTFIIAIFVLLMQFLWSYIDELAGKGLSISVILQLMFYASATFVPMSLPLAILLSSLMTYGNLGENYEIIAAKASGISLWKLMKPLAIVSILLACFTFYFSNTILPKANLKMMSLLRDVREQKPTLNIREGIFNKDLDNYVIKVEKKHKDGKHVENIIIYDHSDFGPALRITTAQSGIMETTPDERYLIFTLFNGMSYVELRENRDDYIRIPLQRIYFDEQVLHIDLSSFAFQRSDPSILKEHYKMLNLSQLKYYIDSLDRDLKNLIENHTNMLLMTFNNFWIYVANDSNFKPMQNITVNTFDSLINLLDDDSHREMYRSASEHVLNNMNMIDNQAELYRSIKKSKTYYEIEWHRKFTLSLTCLLLFFIGAPLGAIIRKGGMGFPLVVSVIVFVLYYIITILFEKTAKNMLISPFLGMWLPTFILLTFGLWISIKTIKDSPLMKADAWIKKINNINQYFKKLFKIKNNNKWH
ncbi:MAG: LptF/LptG family permease [Rikenellaceae bacterium MAG02]|jgi:lipopolysaccharide export system permease protein|nr:YjgP/YjgQ family permease [Bacteroidales bacterium]